ncbi:MAG: hypothetical protein ACHQ9S_16205 [Candidatus Binatia bacterium]
MIYAARDFGEPNAWDPVTETFKHGQLWRTAVGGDWYGLGILPGLPPENSDERLANMPDFSIQISLIEGENDFTILGEPSVMTRTDDYQRFVLNLYFDGVLDHPGISVLFPRYGSRGGDAPAPVRYDTVYALSVAPVQGPPEMTYSDGTDTVSVIAVSFLPPEKFGMDYDKVSAHAPIPSSSDPTTRGQGADEQGGLDYIGVLKIQVDGPSAAPVGVPGVAAPGAFGVVPGSASVGPDLGGYGAVPGGLPQQPGAGSETKPVSESSGTTQRGDQKAAGNTPSRTDTEATPESGQTPTPVETPASAVLSPARQPTAQASNSRSAAPGTLTPAVPAAKPTPASTTSSSGASTPTVAVAAKPVATPTRAAKSPKG